MMFPFKDPLFLTLSHVLGYIDSQTYHLVRTICKL